MNRSEWIEARHLEVGDQLRTLSGEVVSLETKEEESGEFVVYNLDVQEHHNYYASGVLVHNCNEGAGLIAEGLRGGRVSPIFIPPTPSTQEIQEINQQIREMFQDERPLPPSMLSLKIPLFIPRKRIHDNYSYRESFSL